MRPPTDAPPAWYELRFRMEPGLSIEPTCAPLFEAIARLQAYLATGALPDGVSSQLRGIRYDGNRPEDELGPRVSFAFDLADDYVATVAYAPPHRGELGRLEVGVGWPDVEEAYLQPLGTVVAYGPTPAELSRMLSFARETLVLEVKR